MRLLFVGDIVGNSSCEFFRNRINKIKKENRIDTIIVNGENSADNNGLTPYSAKHLFESGADVITTGNHCYKRREMNDMYEESKYVIRPANFGDSVPGRGYCVVDYGYYSLAVINLQGVVFLDSLDNPFKTIDEVLKKIETPNIIVDFHAEATSEKKAMGYYLAGKVSAVIGTHTHVQTADETILSNHTGYITDVGMTGVKESVLGIQKDIIIQKFINHYPYKYEYATGTHMINAVVVEINERNGQCIHIERIMQE